MLLSWHDRLHLALSPSRIDVMRVGGILRRSQASAELIPGIETVADVPWRAPVQALADALPDLAPRGAHCGIVLSNHFCRYTIVPANIGLANEAEVEAYARLRFEEIHGAAAVAGWQVRVGDAPAGMPRLACAIDRALVEELRRVVGAARFKLKSVRPLLAASFDHWRTRFTSQRFWFAAAEEGRVCLAAIEDYGWRSVTSQRIGRNLAEELRAMLDRALIGTPSMETETVYLFSRDHPSDRMRSVSGVKVLALAAPDGAATPDEIARGKVLA